MHNEHQSDQVRSVRTVPLSCAMAFACFTEAHHLERWFSDGTMTATIDLHVGGRYSFTFPHDDGPADCISGEYLEVIPGKRLAFTWEWRESGSRTPASPITTVTVEFNRRGAHCEVVVYHQGLPNQEQLDRHDTGWHRTLSRLEAYASGSGRSI